MDNAYSPNYPLRYFFDTETIGFTGVITLIQYAIEDGPIVLHEVFNNPTKATLKLIEDMVDNHVVGFNLSFDWFHITKLYNILKKISLTWGEDFIPTVDTVRIVESSHPTDYCLRPKDQTDVLLVGRKGKYQSTLARGDIRIRSVPTVIADTLAEHLKARVNIPEIYFAKRKTGYQWLVEEDRDEFSDVVLRIEPSSSLRAMAADALGESKADWPIPKELMVEEESWKVYGGKWPEVAHRHIILWQTNPKARYYAEKDVDLTRKLYYHFVDDIVQPDNDSYLAVCVGGARWKGFAIDHRVIEQLIEQFEKELKLAPITPRKVMAYIRPHLSESEKAVFKSTKKVFLEGLIKADSSAKDKAANVLKARKAKKRLELLYRLREMNSVHPDFKIIGTRSNRMSGGSENTKGGSINFQGIPKQSEFRAAFTLAYPGETVELGDAESYEVTIMDADFKDPGLHQELKSGKKFHGLLGSMLYDVSYDELMAQKDLPKGPTLSQYDRAKNTVFGWAYGAQEKKTAETANVTEPKAKDWLHNVGKRFPGIGEARAKIFNMFCSMRQPGGLGTKVYWHEPADYIENLFGFRRYFTLENNICRELFKLANKLPPDFKDIPGKFQRRSKIQSAAGAVQSALYGMAFQIQARNLRQAGNHRIQSTGGELTKIFQAELERLQPQGIHPFKIRTINMHDEVIAVTDGTLNTTKVRDDIVNKYRSLIPLLSWTWKKVTSWAGK